MQLFQLRNKNKAFTIVELLVVLVVIGILAAITIVSYSGVQQKAGIATIQADLSNAAKKLKMFYALYDTYPDNLTSSDGGITFCPTNPIDNNYCIKASTGNTFSYAMIDSSHFTLDSIRASINMSYRITQDTAPVSLNTPSAPTISSVTPNGSTQVTLNWTAPATNGGFAITGYKIYRGTTSGAEVLTYTIGNVLAYVDNTNIVGGTTYFYTIRAINANGDGAQSSELNGTVAMGIPAGSVFGLHFDNSTTDFIGSLNPNSNSGTFDSTNKKFGSHSMAYNGSQWTDWASSTTFDFGTGDFYLDVWVYPLSASTFQCISARGINNIGSTSSLGAPILHIAANGRIYFRDNYTGTQAYSSQAISINNWHHIRAGRASGAIYVALDGIVGSGVAFTGNLSPSGYKMAIGRLGDNASGYFTGNIDEFLSVKGQPMNTVNFTPPTSPYSN